MPIIANTNGREVNHPVSMIFISGADLIMDGNTLQIHKRQRSRRHIEDKVESLPLT